MADAAFSIAKASGLADPVGRRRAAILAGSIVFHAVILAPLALRLVEAPDLPSFDDDPFPIYVEMEPRPLLEGETAREPSFTRATDTAPALAAATRNERVPTPDDEDDVPAPPSPRVVANAPAGSPTAPADAWTVTPETTRAAVARSLRTGPSGCRMMEGRLSPGEQALCDDRFNEAAGRAGPLGPRTLRPGEARREAQFARDGAAAIARYESIRRAPSGSVGVSGASPDCVGGNLRGTCAGAHLRPEFQFNDEQLRNGRRFQEPDYPSRSNE